MNANNIFLSTAVAAGLFTASHCACAQVVIVMNPKSAVSTMTADQVSAIFLGKNAALPSGGAAAAVDLPDGAPAKEYFYSKVAGKSSAQVKAAWARLVFSGKGVPPKEIATSADVKKFVASNPDAIGYIEKSALDSTVKVVFSAD
jgi:ABC-type phosphate transport system substrate-binding protein